MTTQAFSQLLNELGNPSLYVLDPSISKSDYVALDLSKSNDALNTVDVSSSETLEQYINSYIIKNNAKVAYGGYLETRNIYQRSSYFKDINPETERNIHLGLDLWIAAETPIFSPLDAEVHSFKNNTNHGDYGPTIILKHTIENMEFYTLYGHLSLASIQNLQVGQVFKQGHQIGTLGDASVNGDYAPHLHIQIIKDVQGFVGDYPGVCSKLDLEFYKGNCLDPELLLSLK
ncbi:peptidoglycan DD-metalloendopeptidase family protein [Psychroserpens burtonensis]|uniref:Peptidoglycan DD-metalloendopeptidase family protein n=1 Tax=Psychroserpens burtonensis TaxID=49278 RepID=A0A5C7B3Q2_9FLAO|nr:peptidoglycan DD-metalloendopeptidase family protein [Psychroserpens burtonensis]TXE15389.1 peptidoglycan DD-metalloendopeptidase family protein [Psychroserpens burtonensis]